jgi:hypothetical protein
MCEIITIFERVGEKSWMKNYDENLHSNNNYYAFYETLIV